jgi:hypothetical protein
MGTGMPYHREKAATWETFDSFLSHRDLNVRARHKLATLEHLWDNTHYGHFTAMAEPGNPVNPYITETGVDWATNFFRGLVYHANVDWFGLPIPGAGATAPTDDYYAPTLPKPPFGQQPGQVLTNGWWKNWYGDATEDIVREAYIRAIEVSLGLSHPTDASVITARGLASADGSNIISHLYAVADQGGALWHASLVGTDDETSPAFRHLSANFPRNWPIEFWWTCGLSWFQAWISWSEWPSSFPPAPAAAKHDGRVIVTWLSPGSASHTVYRDLSEEWIEHPAPSVAVGSEPTVETSKRFGSWIVAHEKNDMLNIPSSTPTAPGVWALQFAVTHSYGKVRTIEPPFADGGVAEPPVLAPFDQF